MNLHSLLIIPCLISLCQVSGAQDVPENYKLVFEQSFDNEKSLAGFRFTQAAKWIIADGKSGKALEFTGISDYQPPFRSPHTIGLINDLLVADFVLEADVLQTGKEYGHRDMCIVFGFQDPSHFYYSHIATKMDDNAHQVMIVNDAPRTKISTFTTEGVKWGEAVWHKVRVERSATKGTIRIFFDGVLVEEALDKTFGEGYIGFGSFDDSGKIDNIRIWAPKSKRGKVRYFSERR
jgi:hypothetical protein